MMFKRHVKFFKKFFQCLKKGKTSIKNRKEKVRIRLRFPHPVTLSGMLEMSRMFLPINNNWTRFINEAERTYESIDSDIQHVLMQIANDACRLAIDDKYKKDPWLWDLDWSTQSVRFLKNTKSKSSQMKKESKNIEENPVFKLMADRWPTRVFNDNDADLKPPENVENILKTSSNLAKIQPIMPGYPSWYRDLCLKEPKKKTNNDDENDENETNSWRPGPQLISTKMRVVPKLLRLTWLGYPLHYDEKHGWGYLVPGLETDEKSTDFPYEEVRQICQITKPLERNSMDVELLEINDRLDSIENELRQLENKDEGFLLIESLIEEQKKLLQQVVFFFSFHFVSIFFIE